MKIGLDFDGVITNCGKLKSDGAKLLYGLSIPAEKFNKEIILGEGLLTYEQYRELQKKVYMTLEIGLLMEPVEGVFENIQKLLADNHHITIVSSRKTGDGQAVAEEWLRRNNLSLPFVGVGYGISKARAAQGLDVFVDDDIEKLKPLVTIVPHRFLFSWGYNTQINLGAMASRVASWEDFYQEILALKKKEPAE